MFTVEYNSKYSQWEVCQDGESFIAFYDRARAEQYLTDYLNRRLQYKLDQEWIEAQAAKKGVAMAQWNQYVNESMA